MWTDFTVSHPTNHLKSIRQSEIADAFILMEEFADTTIANKPPSRLGKNPCSLFFPDGSPVTVTGLHTRPVLEDHILSNVALAKTIPTDVANRGVGPNSGAGMGPPMTLALVHFSPLIDCQRYFH